MEVNQPAAGNYYPVSSPSEFCLQLKLVGPSMPYH